MPRKEKPKDIWIVPELRRSVLNELATAMRSYRATPWGKLTKNGATTNVELDYRDFPLSFFKTSDPDQGELVFKNAHAGDLLHHSKWVALQLAIWFEKGEIWTEGLDPTLTILAGFLHDLGKGGDCSFSCIQRLDDQDDKRPGVVHLTPHETTASDSHCYRDIYSALKYDRQDDREHPMYSAKYLGRTGKEFWLRCPDEEWMKQMWSPKIKTERTSFSVNLKWRPEETATVLELQKWQAKMRPFARPGQYFLKSEEILEGLKLTILDEWRLFIAARMHWDLGRLNMPTDHPQYLTVDDFLYRFVAYVNALAECGNSSTESNPDCVRNRKRGKALVECLTGRQEMRDALKLTIAVGAADISGGSPSRESSRAGTDQIEIVSDEMNGAVKLCGKAQQSNQKQSLNLSIDVIQLVGHICEAGCFNQVCRVRQLYPGNDVWTWSGFESKGPGYRAQLLQAFDAFTSSEEKHTAWCNHSVQDLKSSPIIRYRKLLKEGGTAHPNKGQLRPWLRMDYSGESNCSACNKTLSYYVELLPESAFEDATATCSFGGGYIRGLCIHEVCSSKTPCSEMKDLGKLNRVWSRPARAAKYAHFYTQETGGFIYFDTHSNIVGVNVFNSIPLGETSTLAVFSELLPVPREHYMALKLRLIREGVDLDIDSEIDGRARYIWIEQGDFDMMWRGGFAYLHELGPSPSPRREPAIGLKINSNVSDRPSKLLLSSAIFAILFLVVVGFVVKLRRKKNTVVDSGGALGVEMQISTAHLDNSVAL